MSEMLVAKGLKKFFGSGDHVVKAVNEANLVLRQGMFAAVVGKSGSGKSTFLGLLGGLERPDSGSIKIGDEEITKLSEGKLTAYRRKEIGFIFQSYNLIPNLSVLENVLLPMEFTGVAGEERKRRAKELLHQVGLNESKQSRKPSRLSGGEQQRVAIARALANNPKLILADEPTGNLDSQTGKAIFDLLHSLSRSQKTTILVVTHDLAIAGQTDRVFNLSDGKLN